MYFFFHIHMKECSRYVSNYYFCWSGSEVIPMVCQSYPSFIHLVQYISSYWVCVYLCGDHLFYCVQVINCYVCIIVWLILYWYFIVVIFWLLVVLWFIIDVFVSNVFVFESQSCGRVILLNSCDLVCDLSHSCDLVCDLSVIILYVVCIFIICFFIIYVLFLFCHSCNFYIFMFWVVVIIYDSFLFLACFGWLMYCWYDFCRHW